MVQARQRIANTLQTVAPQLPDTGLMEDLAGLFREDPHRVEIDRRDAFAGWPRGLWGQEFAALDDHGGQSSRTGEDLYIGEGFQITAGGDTEIANCKMRFRSDQVSGFVTDAPDSPSHCRGWTGLRWRSVWSVIAIPSCSSTRLWKTGSTMMMVMGTWMPALT